MTSIVINPLPGAGVIRRVAASLRMAFSRRQALGLVGIDSVTLCGRVYAIRAMPLGVARDLVPAIIRASQAFVRVDLAEALYDDIIKALSLGLGAPKRTIEMMPISLWELAPVLDAIARANGLQTMEAGTADMGKLMETWTGTSYQPGSSQPRAGPGTM